MRALPPPPPDLNKVVVYVCSLISLLLEEAAPRSSDGSEGSLKSYPCPQYSHNICQHTLGPFTLARTSDLAPWPVMVDFRSHVSPVMRISGGSIETSLHTFFKFLAKRFLRGSCLPIVNPARGQRRAWLGSKHFSCPVI